MVAAALKNIYDDPVRAGLYDASVRIREDGILRARSMYVEPGWTVLDIGPGPGTLAVPLSPRVKRITAVEPSEAMAELLLSRAAAEGAVNIDLVPKRWEQAFYDGISRHDLVIASYSMLMDDWEEAVAAMNRTARSRVDIYWFEGITAWERMNIDLFPVVHGREYTPGKKIDRIIEVLESLKVRPRILRLSDTSFPCEYPSLRDAVLDLRRRIGVEGNRYDYVFEDYVQRNYVCRKGGIQRPDPTTYVRISWTPGDD